MVNWLHRQVKGVAWSCLQSWQSQAFSARRMEALQEDLSRVKRDLSSQEKEANELHKEIAKNRTEIARQKGEESKRNEELGALRATADSVKEGLQADIKWKQNEIDRLAGDHITQ